MNVVSPGRACGTGWSPWTARVSPVWMHRPAGDLDDLSTVVSRDRGVEGWSTVVSEEETRRRHEMGKGVRGLVELPEFDGAPGPLVAFRRREAPVRAHELLRGESDHAAHGGHPVTFPRAEGERRDPVRLPFKPEVVQLAEGR